MIEVLALKKMLNLLSSTAYFSNLPEVSGSRALDMVKNWSTHVLCGLGNMVSTFSMLRLGLGLNFPYQGNEFRVLRMSFLCNT